MRKYLIEAWAEGRPLNLIEPTVAATHPGVALRRGYAKAKDLIRRGTKIVTVRATVLKV